jgi:hypothetical protein
MDVWALGLLHPTQLRAHPPATSIPLEAVAELDQAWAALTSSDPQRLLDWVSQGSRWLPYFRPSISALLDRYPDHRTGLSRAERDLLKHVQERGPRAIQVVGHTLGRNFGPDLWGDDWLFSRLLHLGDASLPRPAMTLSGDPTSMRTCEVALT